MFDNKIKVLIISTNSDLAGAPIHVRTLVRELHSVIDFIVVFGQDGPIAQDLRDLKIPVEIIHNLSSKINIKFDYFALKSLSKLTAQYSPDLIHAHSSKAGMLARIISFFHKIPCLYTVHGWGWRGLSSFNVAIVFFLEKFLSFLPNTRLIYVSCSVQDDAINKLFLPKSIGVVIPNGVPDVFYSRDTTEPMNNDLIKIFMAARVSSAKDHETLIRAFEMLTFPSVLILCGDGTNSESFLNKAVLWSPNRYKYIQFLGARSDIPNLLNSIDIFALISNFEALPLSLIEAMCAGKALIASDVGGVKELIDQGVNGFLVKKNSVENVIQSLNILSDKEIRNKLGNNSRLKYSKFFSSKVMSQNIYHNYCLMLNRGE